MLALVRQAWASELAPAAMVVECSRRSRARPNGSTTLCRTGGEVRARAARGRLRLASEGNDHRAAWPADLADVRAMAAAPTSHAIVRSRPRASPAADRQGLHQRPGSPRRMRRRGRSASRSCARSDGALVGYLMARADLGDFGRTEPVAVIDTLGVDPEHGRPRRRAGRCWRSCLPTSGRCASSVPRPRSSPQRDLHGCWPSCMRATASLRRSRRGWPSRRSIDSMAEPTTLPRARRGARCATPCAQVIDPEAGMNIVDLGSGLRRHRHRPERVHGRQLTMTSAGLP
jgi:hypothetical protein